MASRVADHGGRVLRFARERKIDYRQVVDFSANINPLGPSPRAMAKLRDSLDAVRLYPEEMADQLTVRLASELRIPEQNILPGNGATDLLYFWLRAIRPRTATLIVPTFSEYRKALEILDVAINVVGLTPNNHFDLPVIHPTTDIVVLTNPNNPSGSYACPEVMREWIEQIPKSTEVLVDEAFVEFTAQPSLVGDMARFPNMWVLRSMTKFYAIPGLRLGYLVAYGVPSIRHLKEPWQVNNLAEVTGIASLDDREHAEATLQFLHRERIWMWRHLQGLAHVRAFPTAANFFLARCDTNRNLDELIEALAHENTLIRDCRNTEGLEGPYFRFAVREHADNVRLLDHLRNI